LQEIIDNTEILKIIEEIRSQYPFTFIGKEKLQKSIDSLSELFWVQDIDGNYQLLNNKLSDSIGVDISQVDGYPVSSFLPAHLQDFYTSIIEYIKKSLRYCVIEGLPIKSSNNDIKYQTIEVPLSDVDNNVIAIIGITQKAVKKNNIKVSNLFESSLNLIENFPKPFALIDKEKYYQFKPFVNHGAPFISAAKSIDSTGKDLLIDFPVKDYVFHHGRVTRRLRPKEFNPRNWDKKF